MPEMDKQQIKALLAKYEAGQCTPEEKALLEHWYFTQQAVLPPADEIQADLDTVWRNIQPHPAVRRLWPRIAAAASILIACSVGGYFLLTQQKAGSQVVTIQKIDIAPGSTKAILTLSNGQQIAVNNHKAGLIASQGNTNIDKKTDDALIYQASNQSQAEPALVYNTLTVPRGGQQPVILADGTHIWLNSASSLKYPVAFNGKDRTVTLTGEAYFEVAHDTSKPFKVITLSPLHDGKDQTVEVLGTHFNINSYADEAYTSTTLLEGSIKLSTPSDNRILKPGQQAQMRIGGNASLRVAEVDTEDAIAWKEGLFVFDEGENLESIMRKVSRWYNVDVEFADPELKKKPFSGSFPRSGKISQVLRKIELTKAASFTITSNKITITKYRANGPN